VQDRYAGDIGDYIKLAILRHLADGQGLGVAWWLFPDEKNGDGGHIRYLEHPEKWMGFDPTLFSGLRSIVRSEQRTVASLHKLFPVGTRFACDQIPCLVATYSYRPLERAKWFQKVKADLEGCDIVRKRDYLPILFDFAVPATRDITETVSLLARMARFIIADLTDPSSIPKELEAIVPDLAVPVQPLLEGSSRPYAMFKDYWKYEWVLPVYRYEGLEPLLATLAEKVIAPAEGKVKALQERRRMIEAELTKPQ
jgi:hypothetical protein